MQETLKEKCLKYRERTDYRLPHNSHVLLMLDGRSFSKFIKKTFALPFDERFVKLMNDTTVYLCQNIQGAKIGYTQSDEISIYLTDNNTPESQLFFDGRLCKILSISAAMASSYFNAEVHKIIPDLDLIQFDCKVWDVPNLNDVYAWFLFRQLDCIRNSKQQAAQTYFPHKQLMGLKADEQIEKLEQEKGIRWSDYLMGEKYGRFIYREKEDFENEYGKFTRNVFKAHDGFDISGEGKDKFTAILSASIKVE